MFWLRRLPGSWAFTGEDCHPRGDNLPLRAARSSLFASHVRWCTVPQKDVNSSFLPCVCHLGKVLHTRRFGTLTGRPPLVFHMPWAPSHRTIKISGWRFVVSKNLKTHFWDRCSGKSRQKMKFAEVPLKVWSKGGLECK